MSARSATFGVLAAAALVAACSSTIGGRPIAAPGAGPTEPSYPTARPTVSPPTTSPSRSATPTTSPTPAGAVPLPPDHDGYVFIETKSGKTRCQISRTAVGCEAEFANPPSEDGEPANGVNVTADGSLEWLVGNLGDIPVVTLDYRTYSAQGWTIAAEKTGTRFTNERTGHGMFVSIEKVEVF